MTPYERQGVLVFIAGAMLFAYGVFRALRTGTAVLVLGRNLEFPFPRARSPILYWMTIVIYSVLCSFLSFLAFDSIFGT
jgi:hypothetical protein